MLLHEICTQHLPEFTEKPAVVSTEETLSYGTLADLQLRLSRFLVTTEVGRGTRVAILARKSPRVVAMMLSLLRSGACYVPLDTTLPPRRLEAILRDCRLEHLVMDSQFLPMVRDLKPFERIRHVFLLGDDSLPEEKQLGFEKKRPAIHRWSEMLRKKERMDRSTQPLKSDLSGDDPAFILYTSGTTGTPKGVVTSHRNALTFATWAVELIDLEPDDEVLNLAPFHFDLSVFDLYATLMRGATVFLGDEALQSTPYRLAGILRERSTTVIYSVPSAYVLLLESGHLSQDGIATLRAILFAGEVFPLFSLRRLMELAPSARFYNLYGPTETNVCLYYPVEKPPSADATEIPLGRPCCGSRISILDDAGKPSEFGEIHVEGPTVMLGYWYDGKLHPSRLPYPTGDLVQLLENGEIAFRGRRDSRIKLRGFRVELLAIERVLLQNEHVAETVVFAKDQQLVAVVRVPDAKASTLELKRLCREHLPAFMVPHRIVFLDSLPRGSRGKIRRTVLRELAESSLAATEERLQT